MSLINKILIGAGIAITLALLGLFLWLSLANAHLKTRLAQNQAGMTACLMANSDFTAAVARQNQAVTALQAQRESEKKQAHAAARLWQTQEKIYLTAAQKLRTAQPQGADCAAANHVFDAWRAGFQ